MPLASIYLKVIAAIAVLWAIVFYAFPAVRPAMDQEEYFVENAQSVLLGLTFLMGIAIAILRWSDRKVRWFALGVSCLVSLALMDELSYLFAIWFAFEFPQVNGTKFDGAHDIVELVWQVKWARPIWAIAGIFLVWRFRAKLFALLTWALQFPPVVVFVSAWGFVFLALFLDLHIIDFGARHAMEEFFELAAAFSLLFTLILLLRFGMKPVYEMGPPVTTSFWRRMSPARWSRCPEGNAVARESSRP